MPGPSSSTVSSTVGRRRCAASTATVRRRVAGRVVEQVAHDARQLVAAAVHAPGGHAAWCRRAPAAAAPCRRARARRGRPRAAMSSGARSGGLVEPGELEQLAHRVLHALVLGERALRRRPASRRGRGCAARPRGWCGSTRAGCAARATRRTRTAAGVCDDVSSRSSIAFIVRASRPTSSSVSGSGTRRCMVVPVIDSASTRIASTGRSARPVKYHAASATSAIMRGHRDQQHACSPSRRCG